MNIHVCSKSLDLFTVIVFICFSCCFKSQVAIDSAEQVFEACYGITVDDFLEPSCNTSEVLYIRDVFTFAKPKSHACPQESTTLNRNDSFCCRYNNQSTDCGWRYYGDSYKGVHYTNCVGQLTCKVQVAWNGTEQNCNQSVFMTKTNYMRQFYHCIQKSLISNICTSAISNGNQLYVWNNGYPAKSGDCATSSGCVCSVSASKSSTIRIELLDLRLHKDISGTCYQRLVISEGGSETSIDCDKNNGFSLTTIYTSQSDSLSIRYDNTYVGIDGNFWISLQAVDSTSELTLTCGNASSVYSCGESLPTSTTTSTTEFSSNSTVIFTGSTMSSPINNTASATTSKVSSSTSLNVSSDMIQQVGQSTDADSSDKTALIAGIAAGALLFAALVTLAGALRHRFKKNKVSIDDEYEEHFGNLKDAKNIAPIGYKQLS
ncbi:uncharacterized protein LOC133200577 [Saccostrea echinata]|uniref:uncharacterized protein LOC133200577 n=1 Tax=Saccostrea echinata TaxID=191078 RepID=UPI002A8240D8|nr:uncharacterized protein LOC133200577 [Saccostrea echinata]